MQCCIQGWLNRLSDQIHDPSSFEKVRLTLQHKLIQVDHIIPRALGGTDHPSNYMLMYRSINIWFGGFFSREKQTYIGKHIVDQAKAAHQEMWGKVPKLVSVNAASTAQRGHYGASKPSTMELKKRRLLVRKLACFLLLEALLRYNIIRISCIGASLMCCIDI